VPCKGSAAFAASWPITIGAACVTSDSSDATTRLVLTANGTRLASADDDPSRGVAISNSYALFAMSPHADSGTGAVTFHDLEGARGERSASRPPRRR
jgi:hypothetical protein